MAELDCLSLIYRLFAIERTLISGVEASRVSPVRSEVSAVFQCLNDSVQATGHQEPCLDGRCFCLVACGAIGHDLGGKLLPSNGWSPNRSLAPRWFSSDSSLGAGRWCFTCLSYLLGLSPPWEPVFSSLGPLWLGRDTGWFGFRKRWLRWIQTLGMLSRQLGDQRTRSLLTPEWWSRTQSGLVLSAFLKGQV